MDGITSNSIESRLATLAAAAKDPPSGTTSQLARLHHDVSVLVAAFKHRLLGTELQWNDADNAQVAWIGATQRRMAELACAISRSLAWRTSPGHPEVLLAATHALYYCGEVVKRDVASGQVSPHDYPAMHFLMQLTMAAGHHRDTMTLELEGRDAPCTLEGLYFRALLLARFAGGVLNDKRTEILDTWLWMWLPLLRGVLHPPPGAALRADLDSDHGLMRGPRGGRSISLYLPLAPLEEAHLSLVREFQHGRILPANRLASTFHIEEHVAVLDLIRRGLREVQRDPVTRAARRAAGSIVAMHVGVDEILKQVFDTNFPHPANTLDTSRRQKAMVSDTSFRQVRLVDESDTGLCVEGSQADCGRVAFGDLVGIHGMGREALVLGRVTRSVPASTPGRVQMGVIRISSASRPLQVSALDEPGAPCSSLLFVPGNDSGGRQDGFIVSDTSFAKGDRIEVSVDAHDFTLRLDRVRERGRGWMLAAFEVADAPDHKSDVMDRRVPA